MTTGPNEDAFPAHIDATNGLTKREYFAAIAFQGCIANFDIAARPSFTAHIAVEFADALIAALNGESQPEEGGKE